MRCAMYIRRSRADVEAEKMGQGATLSRHFDTLMALAKKMKIVIADKDIYREIVSGDTISARPEMQRLLRAVEAGIYGAILCVDVDRLARGDTASIRASSCRRLHIAAQKSSRHTKPTTPPTPATRNFLN
ncbi:MAG TPA: recombinase family protein [Candidatus Ornithocaccomicrobium faecavium]|uniref:Recombinase family protein n=1 Tax=Candidatus Ornithocaccomicrobium faecavium TaxID=2840890 RepID=A0A9D1P9G3_9FIRM|nr:recombinase family protein [Candidatus Ornithocaccomicrobium faecavium]